MSKLVDNIFPRDSELGIAARKIYWQVQGAGRRFQSNYGLPYWRNRYFTAMWRLRSNAVRAKVEHLGLVGPDDFRKFSLSFADMRSVGPDATLTIVIPVYGWVDSFEDLLADLQRDIKRSKAWQNVEVIVTDDASAPADSDLFSEACQQLGVTYRRNPTNVGFIKNVNQAASTITSSHVLLLNSDVRLPLGSLDRLAAVLAAPEVALATLPSVEDLHNLGVSQPRWHAGEDAGPIEMVPYMEACTAVGYAIAWDTRVIGAEVFDPAFGLGYGEDSDLHYRIQARGNRSVLILDAPVLHYGGKSFSAVPDVASERVQGRSLFDERWGAKYQQEFVAFRWHVLNNWERVYAAIPAADVALLLPGPNLRIGGIKVLADAAVDLVEAGTSVSAAVLTGVPVPAIKGAVAPYPWRSEDTASALVGPGLLVYSGVDGIDTLRDVPGNGFSRRKVMVLQGPDHLIEPAAGPRFLQAIAEADDIVCSTDYLEELASWAGAKRVHRFVPRSEPDCPGAGCQVAAALQGESIDLIVVLRVEHGKAGWLGTAVANVVASQGLNVLAIAAPREAQFLVEGVTVIEPPDSHALSHLFDRSKVFFDSSIFEGYGMLAREALSHGCRVVALENGGNTDLASLESVSIVPAYDTQKQVGEILRLRSLGPIAFPEPGTTELSLGLVLHRLARETLG